jgi:hypothetical protein
MSSPHTFSFNYKSRDSFLSALGGGLPGSQPKGGLLGGGAGTTGGSGMEGGGDRAMSRLILRSAFGNHTLLQTDGNLTNPITLQQYGNAPITPFRAAFNAGDINGSVNSAPSHLYAAPNQVNSIQVPVLHIKPGAIHNNGSSAYSGNPKFVYDGSDYSTYRRLKAINKTYNDSNFGGDASNGSYVALRAVRRF